MTMRLPAPKLAGILGQPITARLDEGNAPELRGRKPTRDVAAAPGRSRLGWRRSRLNPLEPGSSRLNPVEARTERPKGNHLAAQGKPRSRVLGLSE
ncbi:hypothetical protein ACFQS7_03620 [Dankookia sp. GCM10030260]|uniref:hypothetical protein n=1 Tax=Dankookia sp. GCM10030260 TaxID=3273390 RepID=UPI00360E97A2